MKVLSKLLFQAPVIFLLGTAAVLWATGYLRIGPPETGAGDTATADAHDHSAHAGEVEEPDPHAGHDHSAHAEEAEEPDPHAGHDHSAHAEEAEEPDPHAGHDHATHAEEAEEPDPHAGHDHSAHAEEAEEPDPHAGHDHSAHAEEAEEPDPHAGHDCEEHDEHEGHDDDDAHDAHEGHDDHEGHDEDDAHAEHDVAESACTRCNPSLIAAFKAKGDWCAGHNLPESQCVACGASVAVPRSSAIGDLGDIEKRRCEHGLRSLDCDNCRFEVGVVKLDPSVAKALLKMGRVEERRSMKVLRLTGQIQFDRSRIVEVPSPAAGRVVQLMVGLGKKVDEGDLLAVLHSGEVAAARASFLESLTACQIAEMERDRQEQITNALEALLKSLPAEIDRPMSGQGAEVQAEVLTGLVGEWKSKLVGAAARLRIARIKHDRELELEEKGISARAEHEEAHQEYESAQAQYSALVEEAKLSIHLEMLKADKAAKQWCAAVAAKEESLRFLGLSEKDLDSLKSGTDEGGFARLELRAPRSGTVTSFEVATGHFVEANEMLFTIADISHLWVWCDLYEHDLAAISGRLVDGGGVPATVRVSSFPGAEFEGELDLLGSEVDVHTRTVKARIQMPNPKGRLRPGMFADVSLLMSGGGVVRVVPRNAVLSDEGVSFVFQYWRDNLWVRRDVEVLETWGGFAAIDGDVPVGATVASGGAFMLKGDVLRDKMGAG